MASKTTLPTDSSSEVARVISRMQTRMAVAQRTPIATITTPSNAASRHVVSRTLRNPDVRVRTITTTSDTPRAPSIHRGSTHDPYHQTSIV